MKHILTILIAIVAISFNVSCGKSKKNSAKLKQVREQQIQDELNKQRQKDQEEAKNKDANQGEDKQASGGNDDYLTNKPEEEKALAQEKLDSAIDEKNGLQRKITEMEALSEVNVEELDKVKAELAEAQKKVESAQKDLETAQNAKAASSNNILKSYSDDELTQVNLEIGLVENHKTDTNTVPVSSNINMEYAAVPLNSKCILEKQDGKDIVLVKLLDYSVNNENKTLLTQLEFSFELEKAQKKESAPISIANISHEVAKIESNKIVSDRKIGYTGIKSSENSLVGLYVREILKKDNSKTQQLVIAVNSNSTFEKDDKSVVLNINGSIRCALDLSSVSKNEAAASDEAKAEDTKEEKKVEDKKDDKAEDSASTDAQ